MIHPAIRQPEAEVYVTCPRCSGDAEHCDLCDEQGNVPQTVANEAIAAGKVDLREFVPRFRTTYRHPR